MNLAKTRHIISLFLIIALSTSLSLAVSAIMVSKTFANPDYMEKHIVTDELVSECKNQLYEQFRALEVKSGIPARVFLNVNNETSVQKAISTSVDYFFDGIDIEAIKNSKTEYFYLLCTEYLDGNNLAYSEQGIRNTAAEAADIYNNCTGVSNSETLYDFVCRANDEAPRAVFIFLASAIFFGALFFVLFKSRTKSVSYVMIGVSVSGFSMLFISIISLAFGTGTHFAMAPQVYYEAFCSVIRWFFAELALWGTVLAAAGVLGNLSLKEKRKKHRRRHHR